MCLKLRDFLRILFGGIQFMGWLENLGNKSGPFFLHFSSISSKKSLCLFRPCNFYCDCSFLGFFDSSLFWANLSCFLLLSSSCLFCPLALQKSRSLFTHKDLSTIANPRKTTGNDTIIRKSRSRWAYAKCYFFYFVACPNSMNEPERIFCYVSIICLNCLDIRQVPDRCLAIVEQYRHLPDSWPVVVNGYWCEGNLIKWRHQELALRNSAPSTKYLRIILVQNDYSLQLVLVHEMTRTDVTVPEHSGCRCQSSFRKATPRKMALPANTMHHRAGWLRA